MFACYSTILFFFFLPLLAIPEGSALPLRGFTVVSPEGYVFTFVFTIKCCLEVMPALCLTSPDRKREGGKKTQKKQDSK